MAKKIQSKDCSDTAGFMLTSFGLGSLRNYECHPRKLRADLSRPVEEGVAVGCEKGAPRQTGRPCPPPKSRRCPTSRAPPRTPAPSSPATAQSPARAGISAVSGYVAATAGLVTTAATAPARTARRDGAPLNVGCEIWWRRQPRRPWPTTGAFTPSSRPGFASRLRRQPRRGSATSETLQNSLAPGRKAVAGTTQSKERQKPLPRRTRRSLGARAVE